METPDNGEASEKTHGATNQTKLGLHRHLQIILTVPINNSGGDHYQDHFHHHSHYHHHGHLQIIVIMSINNNSDLQISVKKPIKDGGSTAPQNCWYHTKESTI